MNDLIKMPEALGGRPMFYDWNGQPIHDTLEWARLFEGDRRVAMTQLYHPTSKIITRYLGWLTRCVWKYLMTWEHMPRRRGAGIVVSTVWLGMDMSFTMQGPPIIFETMVFDGHYGECYCDRYANENEARAGHEKAVAWVKAGMPDVE